MTGAPALSAAVAAAEGPGERGCPPFLTTLGPAGGPHGIAQNWNSEARPEASPLCTAPARYTTALRYNVEHYVGKVTPPPRLRL
jgi:hypothetical protein